MTRVWIMRRKISRATALHASYRFIGSHYHRWGGITRPDTQQTVTGGASFATTLGRQRTLSVSLNAGGTTSNRSAERWSPTPTGRLPRMRPPRWPSPVLVGRGGYQRGFTSLQSLTGLVYANDTASVTTDGRFGSRIASPWAARTRMAVP